MGKGRDYKRRVSGVTFKFGTHPDRPASARRMCHFQIVNLVPLLTASRQPERETRPPTANARRNANVHQSSPSNTFPLLPSLFSPFACPSTSCSLLSDSLKPTQSPQLSSRTPFLSFQFFYCLSVLTISHFYSSCASCATTTRFTQTSFAEISGHSL